MKQTKRDIQKQETKLKIYKAALTLIKRQGYTATTIRQITRQAHVSAGTFYVHYNSKEDIIRENYYGELSSYVSERYTSYIQRNPSASLREKILYFSSLQLKLSAEQGWQFVTIVFTSFFTETLNPNIALRDWKMLDTLKVLLREANNQNLLRNKDPEIAFQQLYSSVRGVMATWAYSRGSFDIVFNGEEYLQIVLNGLLKQ